MAVKGINVYNLSQKADLSQACISNWFNGRNYEPSLSALEKVCNGLEISMAELFCTDEDTMLPIDNQTKELLLGWQKLSTKQKEAIMMLIRSI